MTPDDIKPTPAPPNASAAPTAPAAVAGLGAWSFYFLAKLILYWRELIGFHPLENIGFAVFLLLPAASPLWRRLRTAVAVPVAVSYTHLTLPTN